MPVNVDNDIIKVTVSNSSQKNTVVVAPVIKYSGELITSLDQLTDVELTSLANNNELRYNDTSRKWENVPYVAPTPPPDNIGDLSDVANTLGTTGQVLAVNTAGDALEYVDVSSDNIATANLTQTGNRTLDNAGYTLSFANGSTPNLFIDGTTGNVGIGTTSPARDLHVVGNVLATGQAEFRSAAEHTFNGIIKFANTGNSSRHTTLARSGDDFEIRLTNNLHRFHFDGNDGYFGIGTTTPSEKLTVDGNIKVLDGNVLLTDGGVERIKLGNDGKITVSNGSNNEIAINGTARNEAIAIGVVSSTGQRSVSIGSNAGRFLGVNDTDNVFIGHSAGRLATSNKSVYVGKEAGEDSDGDQNVAIGYQALEATGSTASNTVAVGYQALTALASGEGSIAVGYQAGYSNTSGTRNASLGYQANYAITTGTNNTAVGWQANRFNVTTSHNTGVGYLANSRSTGSNNTAVGAEAAEGVIGSSTFSNTTAVGYQALTALTTGTGNTAVGYQAGNGITTTSSNTIVGYDAQATHNGTVIGYEANGTGSNVTLIGYRAAGGYESTAVGYVANNNGAIKSVSLGYAAGQNASGQYNHALGYRTLRFANGNNNTAVGSFALEGVSGSSTFANTTAVGYQALTALTTGTGNTAVGYQAGDGITTANYNTVVGYSADVGTSHSSTVMGYQASGAGSGVVAIGYQAQGGVITNGYQNTGLGYQSNYQGPSEKNVSLGAFAGYSGNVRSVSVGHGAGYSGADYGVFIGYQAGYNETGSNKLYIENSNSTTPLIYGEFDNDIVRVNGSLEVTEGITVDETGLASAGDYGKGSEVWYQGTGATTAGSLYYLNSSGDWANTDASAASTAKGMLAFAAGTDSDSDGMVTKGFVYLGTDAGGSVGDVVYLSETANQATTTAPTTSGAIVRVLGYKVATNVIWFNPSNDWIELS